MNVATLTCAVDTLKQPDHLDIISFLIFDSAEVASLNNLHDLHGDRSVLIHAYRYDSVHLERSLFTNPTDSAGLVKRSDTSRITPQRSYACPIPSQ